jgi:hypothetical protein
MRASGIVRCLATAMCVLAAVAVGCHGRRDPAVGTVATTSHGWLDRVAASPVTLCRTPVGHEWYHSVGWSRDGRLLLATAARPSELGARPSDGYWSPQADVYVIRVADGQAEPLGQCTLSPVPQFAPDGRHVLLNPGGADGDAVAWRSVPADGADVIVYRCTKPARMLAASQEPDGNEIAISEVAPPSRPGSSAYEQTIRVTDRRAGTSRVVARLPLGSTDVCWSPRSELVWGEGDPADRPDIALATPPHYSVRRVPFTLHTSGSDRPVWPPGLGSWSPDGSRLLIGVWADQPLVAVAVNVDARPNLEIPRLPGLEYDPRLGVGWSPDGALIAVGARRLGTGGDESYVAFCSVTDAGVSEAKLVGPMADRLGRLAWSPKGDAIAFARDGEVDLIRIEPVDR